MANMLRAFVECWPDPEEIPLGVLDAADMLIALSSRLAAERKELGHLRAAFRVNGYRAGFTDAEIDKALAEIMPTPRLPVVGPAPSQEGVGQGERGHPKRNTRENGLVEHVCVHGIGHPSKTFTPPKYYYGVHGCDGCCQTEWFEALEKG